MKLGTLFLCGLVTFGDAASADRQALFSPSDVSFSPVSKTKAVSLKKIYSPFLLAKKKEKDTTKNQQAALQVRGGGCSDSDPVLFVKIGISAILQSALMLGTLVASVGVSDKYPSIPSVFNLPLVELLCAFAVIFASSVFGGMVDGGLSTAGNQVLKPTEVPGSSNWYIKLKKPSWNPPGWVFPIMWLIVSKPTQLCAVSRILKYGITRGEDGAKILPLGALAVYTSHLALGDAWNKVFFGLQCTGRGAAVISVFYAVLLASAYSFYSIDEKAGYYMLPTVGWVTVATALNWNIYLNNKTKK